MPTATLKIATHPAAGRVSTSSPAELPLGQAIQSDYDVLSESGSAVIRAWRQEAMARFERLGFPTARMEAWKGFPLRDLLNQPFALSAKNNATLTLSDLRPYLLKDALHMVFIDGRYQANLSCPFDHENGLHVGSVALGLSKDDTPLLSEVSTLADEYDPMAVLNAAMFEDGACIKVPDNLKVEQPIHVLFVSTQPQGDERVATYPRNHIHMSPGSKAHVLFEQLQWPPCDQRDAVECDAHLLSNAAQQITVAHEAELDLTILVNSRKHSWTLQATRLHLSEKAKANLTTVTLGDGIARYSIESSMHGKNAEMRLNGLDVLTDKGTVHHETVMSHHVGDCVSDQFYKGVLDNQSHSSFSGLVYVAAGANRTDSRQLNKNLLLSDSAKASSRPQLKINADDVKCAHGATVGSLEDDQLFYLASRGLDKQIAQSLLTYGFAEEVLQTVEQPAIHKLLDCHILNTLRGAAMGELRKELQ